VIVIPVLVILLLLGVGGGLSRIDSALSTKEAISPQQLIANATIPIPCKTTPTNDSLALAVMSTQQFKSAEGGATYVFAYKYPITTTQGWQNGTTVTFSGIQLIFANFGGNFGYCGGLNGAKSLLVINVPTDAGGRPDLTGMQIHEQSEVIIG